MKIGIDASRAFIKNKTGIEEYSFQVIKHLANKLAGHQVRLYVRRGQIINLKLPENWEIRVINFPYLWTQIGLSIEMAFCPVDVLFVPAHIIPWITPKKTVVTIHGLEYEFCAGAYSLWERLYMRFFIRRSCRKASGIIAVSENTKKDLVSLYKVLEEKIAVIYEGYSNCHSRENGNPVLNNNVPTLDSRLRGNDKFLLFIGRLEERKNVLGIIRAFEMLKEKYDLPHKLVLAGKPGFDYAEIKSAIENSKFRKDIQELGFVSEEKKGSLLKNADVFLFPSFYEGFGLPILEAQSVGVPVVASNISSIPEVAGTSAVLVDPKKTEEIAKGVYKLVSDEVFRNGIIQRGLENVKRFGWEKCAKEIAEILIKK